LCWFARHNDYIMLMGRNDRQRRAFPAEEFSDYSPHLEPDSPAEQADPYEQLTWFDLRAEIKKLKAENQFLLARETVANQNTDRIQKLHHEARRAIDELTGANRMLLERLQQLEETSS
jgi:hypothetical protein